MDDLHTSFTAQCSDLLHILLRKLGVVLFTKYKMQYEMTTIIGAFSKIFCLAEIKKAFMYYVSMFGEMGALSQNADSVDAWEGGGRGIYAKMLRLLTLGRQRAIIEVIIRYF